MKLFDNFADSMAEMSGKIAAWLLILLVIQWFTPILLPWLPAFHWTITVSYTP